MSLPSLPIEFGKLDWREVMTPSEIVTSVVVIITLIAIRGFLIRYIRKDTEILGRDQRRWIIRVKNTAAILIVIALIFIWAPQLHTFAISIAAFGVALVIATKEMILCLTGAIMRTTSQPFKVGEWITIDGVTGEVVDLDAFAFRLQEVDMESKTYQYTGRTITVPNSKLFTSNIENSNFFKHYIYEDVRVAVQYENIDPALAMKALKEIVERYFNPHRKSAVEFNRSVRRRSGVDVGMADPLYDLTTSELGHYQFHVRMFLPTAVAPSIGSDISRDFLARVHKMRKGAKAEHSVDEDEAASQQTPPRLE